MSGGSEDTLLKQNKWIDINLVENLMVIQNIGYVALHTTNDIIRPVEINQL